MIAPRNQPAAPAGIPELTVTTPVGDIEYQWVMTGIILSGGAPVAQYLRQSRSGGYASPRITFDGRGMSLSVGSRTDVFTRAVVDAAPEHYPASVATAVIAHSIDQATAASTAAGPARGRSRAAALLAYLRLLERSYTVTDPDVRALALSLVAAGFDGTPDELEVVAEISHKSAAVRR